MANREVDTGRVIDEVRPRKKLRDASDPLYKNKDARNKAWEDIMNTLFENISGEEKQQLGHASNRAHKVISKMFSQSVSRPVCRKTGPTTMENRDAFFRTKNAMKKTPSGSAAPKYKKYIYYDLLSFLAPTVENEVDESLNETIPSPSLPSPTVNIDNTLDSMGAQSDRGVDSASSQKPWLEKRKRRAPKANPESSPFEKELLTLLRQKLEFRTRVLREATDIRNCNRSNSSYSNDARSTLDTYASSYNYQTPGYPGYETNDANPGYSGYQTARRTDE
ncbi:Uncharacterized protein OBRU01_20474 [Operophtera brumata]|uniref:MADF domain-containing protein n=1 Tax=Operophtera brumata TaxID=104452 RepID=A0A0L7KV52_OPEBR|nr:Uncharacterized protein OBRU01_20474 [Operophtera brumata]